MGQRQSPRRGANGAFESTDSTVCSIFTYFLQTFLLRRDQEPFRYRLPKGPPRYDIIRIQEGF